MTAGEVWSFARRWLWLLLLGAAIGAASAYLFSARMPRVYESNVKLLVALSGGSGAADYPARLASTYAAVIKTRPVVEAALRSAGSDLTYESVAPGLDVTPATDSQLIQLTVRAADPEEAARFANVLADVGVQQIQSSEAARLAASRERQRQLAASLADELAQRQQTVDALRAQEASPARDEQLARAQAALAQTQESYGAATSSYRAAQLDEARAGSLLTVVDPAVPGNAPILPRVPINVAMGAIVGLLVALGAAALTELMTDRLASPERVWRRTGLPVLGLMRSLKEELPIVELLSDPATNSTATAESFRLLRAAVRSSMAQRPIRTLLVTSVDEGDGKTTIAAGLAITMALSGERVVLVDASLRQPTLDAAFSVANEFGLSWLLANEQLDAAQVLVPADVHGLQLLTTGPAPLAPGELLASRQMHRRLVELSALADLVIVDSSSRNASDAVALAGWTDAALVVVDAQRTRGADTQALLSRLGAAGTTVLGIVLNRAPNGGLAATTAPSGAVGETRGLVAPRQLVSRPGSNGRAGAEVGAVGRADV